LAYLKTFSVILFENHFSESVFGMLLGSSGWLLVIGLLD